MRAKIQRKRAVLLLVAILAPCCLLVVLAARMYRQESELAEQRAGEERRRTREQARLERLTRLEKITGRPRRRKTAAPGCIHRPVPGRGGHSGAVAQARSSGPCHRAAAIRD